MVFLVLPVLITVYFILLFFLFIDLLLRSPYFPLHFSYSQWASIHLLPSNLPLLSRLLLRFSLSIQTREDAGPHCKGYDWQVYRPSVPALHPSTSFPSGLQNVKECQLKYQRRADISLSALIRLFNLVAWVRWALIIIKSSKGDEAKWFICSLFIFLFTYRGRLHDETERKGSVVRGNVWGKECVEGERSGRWLWKG